MRRAVGKANWHSEDVSNMAWHNDISRSNATVAALIAAAPDMRQALLDLVNWYDMDEGDLRPLMNKAREVLSRVEKL